MNHNWPPIANEDPIRIGTEVSADLFDILFTLIIYVQKEWSTLEVVYPKG